MPISSADLAALKQRIKTDMEFHENTIKSLGQELAAVELLEKRVSQEKSVEQRLLDLEEEPIMGPKQPSVSFAEATRRAVRLFKREPFTVADVENMLKAQKVTLPAKNVRTRISLEVGDLVRKKTVHLVEKGSGHTPHTYRLASVDEPEKSERPSLIPRRGLSAQH
jgi:hypothetical protein